MHHAPITPTDEQLAAAWAKCARPEWGLDMAQTKAAALHWSLVVMHARLLAGGVAVAAASATPAPTPPAPPAREARRLTYPAHRYQTGGEPFDVKRAAAGDRDDD